LARLRLQRAVIAADAGQIVDPEGLKSQLEGGLIQSASWTLKEQVDYDSGGILSRDWDSYPILTMAEAPVIETVLIDRPDQPFLGAGEATQGPTAAAIANAVFDAALHPGPGARGGGAGVSSVKAREKPLLQRSWF
jgi:CO/xanthine dehydrogenase Mo-binding subunit